MKGYLIIYMYIIIYIIIYIDKHVYITVYLYNIYIYIHIMYSFISRLSTDVSSTFRWLQDLGTFVLMHNGVCRHNGKDEGKSGDLRSGEELALGMGENPL